MAHPLYGSDEYSHDECGNCNGRVPDAAFIACRMTLGFGTILIAHITFNIPYVILSVAPKLKQTNRHVYEAALDLGASPLNAFLRWYFRILYLGCFPDLCWHLPCLWMIL